ncbi:MAG TPA: hypothetical protein VIL52_07640 [Bacteroidota bacterium]
MKSQSRAFMVGVFAVLLLTTASAQQVNVNLQLPNYDVIYAADLYDISTQSLTSAIPNFGIELNGVPADLSILVEMRLVFRIRLQGDAAPSDLLTARTEPFTVTGSKFISARDLVRGARGDIRIRAGSNVNSTLQDRLEERIRNVPTLPVGQYTIAVEVLSSPGNVRLGGDSRTLEIRNASAGELTITLLEPQDGAAISSLLPTFSWSAAKPRARIKVYEKLPHHQSPQEAVTGIPHLNAEVNGSVYTYSPDARKLDVGKAYYWFIETVITSNRGNEVKQSEIRMFRVASGNMTALFLLLEQLFSTYGADLAPLLVSMQSMGLQLTGEVTLDGSRVTREQLAQLFDGFVRNQTRLNVRIE